MVFLGFDPGGINNFGWATLHVNEDAGFNLATGVVSNAPDAVRLASQMATSEPLGIGIDAPLFWVQQGELIHFAPLVEKYPIGSHNDR
ncbi:MAG: hypothetical protein EPO42_05905 [Gallionellaceae bacterium]|nr:MAG: hypothetical protein EPO42_05905 [Gallionellaceae bacterium]